MFREPRGSARPISERVRWTAETIPCETELVSPAGAPSASEAAEAPSAAMAMPAQGSVLKEVIVFRSPPVVHVYDVISHGRRFYRTLIFSSDNAFALHNMPTTLFLQAGAAHGRALAHRP